MGKVGVKERNRISRGVVGVDSSSQMMLTPAPCFLPTSAYCSVIIIGLIFSTCALYSFDAWAGTTSSRTSAKNATEQGVKSVPVVGSQVPLASLVMPSPPAGAAAAPASTEGAKVPVLSRRPLPPSSCWIDLTGSAIRDDEQRLPGLELGWWSAPTRRANTTALGSLRQWRRRRQDDKDHQGMRGRLATWLRQGNKKQASDNSGIFVGWGDVGFRLKLYLD